MTSLKMLMRGLLWNEIIGRIAVTDGMDEQAIMTLENAGYEVASNHYSIEELLDGVLAEFDAVVVRSATKLSADVIESSSSDGSKFCLLYTSPSPRDRG